MARKRRDNTTAASVNVGDLIEPTNNGIRATVTRVGTLSGVTEPHVAISYAYPDDHSVNENFRGVRAGRAYRPGDPITRWLG